MLQQEEEEEGEEDAGVGEEFPGAGVCLCVWLYVAVVTGRRTVAVPSPRTLRFP